MPRAGCSSSPHLRRSVPRRTRLQNLKAHKTCPAGRISRGVGAAVTGGDGGVDLGARPAPLTLDGVT